MEYTSKMERSKDLMLILGLNVSTDQFAITSSVCCYGHVLWREDGHVLISALDFEDDGQRKKWKLKRTWKKQVKEESVNGGFRREGVLYLSK